MVEISLSGSGEGPGEQSPGLLYHPHAVTSAGGDSFAYNAVGNQFARPGGVTVTYTPFDLPKSIQQDATTVATLGYDGDQKRIRKTTPDRETLYFGDLYERVTTKKGPAKTEHRYYVSVRPEAKESPMT
jgi:YD repeat-containing protein